MSRWLKKGPPFRGSKNSWRGPKLKLRDLGPMTVRDRLELRKLLGRA